ncbi:MAG: ATP-binding protein [Puniceicoccaceae bacterium]
MSSSIFPQFLFLVGLNFINVLIADPLTGPAYRFAEKLESVPPASYHDVSLFADDIWLAGEGLYRLSGDQWETIRPSGRVTALAVSPNGNTLWFADSAGVGGFDRSGKLVGFSTLEVGFVWSLEWYLDRLWYIASEGFGWIEPDTFQVGQHWKETFNPRPVVYHADAENPFLYVGSGSGIWRITAEGRELILPIEMTDGELVAWLERTGEKYTFGTNFGVYYWSGKKNDEPVLINSNYGDFFKKGINNSAGLGDYIAITEYPLGVAVWNRSLERISESVSSDEKLDLGDVFKIRALDKTRIAMLGDKGVGVVDFSRESKFFPSGELWEGDSVRHFLAGEEAGFLFLDEGWIRLDNDGYEKGELLRTASWVDVDKDGLPVMGAVNIYEEFNGEDWSVRELTQPISSFKWGQSTGFALGVEGIYSVSDTFELELIHKDERQIELIGELDSGFYALIGGKQILQLIREGSGWRSVELPYKMEDVIIAHAAGENAVWLASPTVVYRWRGESLERFPLAPGWTVRSLSNSGEDTYVLFEDPATRNLAVGMYSDAGNIMMTVPFLEQAGEAIGLMGGGERLGIVGAHGVGWYAVPELSRAAAPRVEFALLLEDKRIEDRTIPSGMHFIDLQVNFSEPDIPSIVQYRINEQRWRNVNLQDPSLQFAGHGNFTVELRAMHPNGNVSSSKLVQFGIAPPWYLNPIYQGVMVVAALFFFWGLFALRSAQLKRTNLWLQSEVKKQTRELEAATAARTNFLAGLSHDIRNPLNGVLMITETLTRNPPESGDDPRLKDLTEFGVIVDRMLGEILDFSAIDQKNIPTAFIPVSIHDLIESSVKQNQFSLQHEMVNLNTVISPELADVVIRTDRNWMIKILSNLLVNALQYAESDRVEIGATCINITDHEVDLELYVADWGIGIDESEREFIFERFYRGESGVESGKHGTGLGLSICQEIAHAMGGHLRLEDNQPSGCRFVLKGRFDRVEGATELDKEAVLAQLKGKKILVVDDLVYNRRSVVEFFETIGCSCDEAENGRDALEQLEKNDYYLALLDWDLPGLTGPEIARRHRKKDPDDEVILVAVTAYTDGEKKRESEEAGMNGYISKPLTAARLAYCLANIQNYKPELASTTDMVAADEVMEEIYKHIDECLLYGDRYEWENLRRCAHRLTTLAMIRNNRAMQQVCRDLQVSAQNGDMDEIHVGLLELRKWRRS